MVGIQRPTLNPVLLWNCSLWEPLGQTGVCLFVTLAPGAQDPRERKLYE